MNWRRYVALFMIFVNFFLTSGCWNYREIEKVAIAAGVGIDKNPISKEYTLTVEIINTSGKGTENAMSSSIYSATGKTIFEAVRKIRVEVGKKIFWSHAKVIILSKVVAEEGAVPAIDWFDRDAEPRQTMWVLIALEESVKDIFEIKTDANRITSFHLEDVMNTQNVANKFTKTEFRDFVNSIGGENQSAVAPTIKVDIKNNRTLPRIEGVAVFKKDKMVGTLNGDETAAMLFVKNKIERGLLLVSNVEEKQANVTLEIFNSKTKMVSSYENEVIMMKIDVKTEVGIDEIGGSIDIIDEKNRDKIKKQAEKELKHRMEKVIEKLEKELHTDIINFGRTVEINQPSLWKKVKSDWQGKFSTVSYDINVEINIRGSGRTSKPIEANT